MQPSPKLTKLLTWIIAISVVVVLMLGAVRVVLNPWYVQFAYNVIGVPPDLYGFSTERRVEYALVALEYLVNDAGIEFLGDLRFPQGEQAPIESCRNLDLYQGDCTRLYNTRELEHMLDVKIVIGQVTWFWGTLLGVLVLLGAWAWREKWLGSYTHAIGLGGWLTLILIFSIIAIVLLAFVPFFIFFHQVFFESGTWMFLWSDTLIRLFPMMFWQNTFIIVGVIAALGGLVLGLLFAPWRRAKA
jgi:integral membrane protein (TIGR01906 family)